MSDSSKDNPKRTQDLISRTLSQQVRAAQRYANLLSRFGRGDISAQAMSSEFVRFTSQETGRYASDMIELGLRFYSDLLALNQTYGDRFISSFDRDSSLRPAEAPRTGEPPKRVAMDLRAPLGREAVGAFVLENKRGGTAQISFEVTDFSGPAAGASFPADLLLQPDHFILDPGQEQTVTIRLALREGVFEAGQRYTASVIVHGYENLVLDLAVIVDEIV